MANEALGPRKISLDIGHTLPNPMRTVYGPSRYYMPCTSKDPVVIKINHGSPMSYGSQGQLAPLNRIAIVDFSGFLDGTRKKEVADAMLRSFKEIGFVYLANHGLPEDKVAGMFQWVLSYLVSDS